MSHGGEHGYLPENRDMDAASSSPARGCRAGADLGRIDMRDVAPTLAGRWACLSVRRVDRVSRRSPRVVADIAGR